LAILENLPIATPQRIQERYESDYGVSVSWHTIRNRLTELLKEGKVVETITTPKANIKGKIKTRIHRIYSLEALE
jgi:hypothetical protein